MKVHMDDPHMPLVERDDGSMVDYEHATTKEKLYVDKCIARDHSMSDDPTIRKRGLEELRIIETRIAQAGDQADDDEDDSTGSPTIAKQERNQVLREKRNEKHITSPVTSVDEKRHEQVFDQYLRGKITLNELGEETRALTSTAQGGANVIPETLYGTLIKKLTQQSTAMQICQVINVGSKVDKIAAETDVAIIPEQANEDSPFTEDVSNQYTSIDVDTKDYGTFLDVSNQQLQDSAFDITAALIEKATRRLALTIDTAVFSPTGLHRNPTAAVTTASNSKIDYEELLKLKYGVKSPYRTNGVFVGDGTTMVELYGMTDNNKAPIITINPTIESYGSRLLGQPVYENDTMQDFAADKHVLLYGDFFYTKLFMIRDITVLQDSISQAIKNMHRLVFTARVGYAISNPDAVKSLKTRR